MSSDDGRQTMDDVLVSYYLRLCDGELDTAHGRLGLHVGVIVLLLLLAVQLYAHLLAALLLTFLL